MRGIFEEHIERLETVAKDPDQIAITANQAIRALKGWQALWVRRDYLYWKGNPTEEERKEFEMLDEIYNKYFG